MKLWVLLFLTAISLCSCGQKREPKEVSRGYKGEARSNPYLLAQRYLKEKGWSVEDQKGAMILGDDDAMIILPVSSVKLKVDADELLDWVSWGGHAVILVEYGDDYRQDIGEYASHQPQNSTYSWENEDDIVHSIGLDYIADELYVDLLALSKDEDEDFDYISVEGAELENIESDEAGSLEAFGKLLRYVDLVDIELDNRPLKAGLGGEFSFGYGYEYEEGEFGDSEEDHRLLSLWYGDGRVTFVSDARLFRNPYLQMKGHAELLNHLVEQSPRSGVVVFNHGKIEGIFGLLMQHFAVAVWSLLALILFWLWKNLPRFGPRQDILEVDERDQMDHLVTTGNYLWSKGCDTALLVPLRIEVIRRLQGKGDTLNDVHVEQIVEATELPRESVLEAMSLSQISEPNVMVRVVNRLQLILKSI